MGPGPPGWQLGVGLTNPTSYKHGLLGNQKCGLGRFDEKDATFARDWKEQSRGRRIWRRSIMKAKARIGL